MQDSYDSTYLKRVAECPLLTADQVLADQSPETKEVRVEYLDRDDFTRKARMFRVMDDLKVCSLSYDFVTGSYFLSGGPSVVVVSQMRLLCVSVSGWGTSYSLSWHCQFYEQWPKSTSCTSSYLERLHVKIINFYFLYI